MLRLISQDGLKAIDFDKVAFFAILPDKNQCDNYTLFAKSPNLPAGEGLYDFLIMFEHEDIQVVKKVLRFLVYLDNSVGKNESLVVDVDIPKLKRFGFNRMTDSKTNLK